MTATVIARVVVLLPLVPGAGLIAGWLAGQFLLLVVGGPGLSHVVTDKILLVGVALTATGIVLGIVLRRWTR